MHMSLAGTFPCPPHLPHAGSAQRFLFRNRTQSRDWPTASLLEWPVVCSWASRMPVANSSAARSPETRCVRSSQSSTASSSEIKPAFATGYSDRCRCSACSVAALGAKALNEAVETLAMSVDPDHMSIVHLTGRDHFDEIAAIAARSGVDWKPVAFEDRMEMFYAVSDLVLSRAGAMTINELAATGTPAVVVPLGLGTNQAANALELESAGGLIQVSQAQIDQIPVVIDQLIVDRTRREAMGVTMAALGRPAAAQMIAGALREVADG